MLSERDRREMKADAASVARREDFERLRAAARTDPTAPVDLDQIINFLSVMNRFGPTPPPRDPVPYANARL